MVKEMEKKVITINDNCEARIKPKLIREVKTEALLVFARTALERFFNKVDNENIQPLMKNNSNADLIYNDLRDLLEQLKKYVVNVEYLIELVKITKQNPQSQQLRQLAKYEEPLITYYDAMARRMFYHFPTKTTLMPEFIVICTLSNWLIEEEKSTKIYPFLDDFDFLKLIDEFELYGKTAIEQEKKVILNMHKISFDIVQILKNTKYKFNKNRVSKKRKKK